jgi:hypothetical protein
METMHRTFALVVLLGALVAACAAPAAPSQSAAAGMPLRVAPGDVGCDTIGISYTSARFVIDPTAADPVTAVSDKGRALRTFWAAEFVGGPPDDPVVRDGGGQVVARHGDVLEIPADGFPELHGHFVCPSEDALYIFNVPPPL